MIIFAFGTLWFWLLLAVASIFIIACLETDWGGTGATIAMIVTFVALFFWSDLPFRGIGSWIIGNPGTTILLIIGYFTAGVIWSFVKWYFYLANVVDEAKRDSSQHYYENDFKASRNKGKITSWMTYWPLSAVWTLVNDPIKRSFNYIYSRIENLYERIGNKMLADLKKEKANNK